VRTIKLIKKNVCGRTLYAPDCDESRLILHFAKKDNFTQKDVDHLKKESLYKIEIRVEGQVQTIDQQYEEHA